MSLEKYLGGKKILKESKTEKESFKKKWLLFCFFLSSHDFMMAISSNLLVSWSCS